MGSDKKTTHLYSHETTQGLMGLAFERPGDAGSLVLAGKSAANEEAESERRELIERSRRGEQIELMLDAITYRQMADKANRNNIEFSPGALAMLKRTASGTPFIRDHRMWDTDASGGMGVSAKLENGQDGNRSLAESIRLTVPWAVQAALDGRMQKFSIGWEPVGDPAKAAQCTACNKLVSECRHYPGQLVEGKDGRQITAGWRWLNVAMIERSWVLYPAVQETQTQGWQQLWVLCDQERSNTMDKEKIAILLGLSANASEGEIETAIKAKGQGSGAGSNAAQDLQIENAKLRADVQVRTSELDAARAKATELEAKRADIEVKVTELATKVDEMAEENTTLQAQRDEAASSKAALEAEVAKAQAEKAEAEKAKVAAELTAEIGKLCEAGKMSPAQVEAVRAKLASDKVEDHASAQSIIEFARLAAPSVVGQPRQSGGLKGTPMTSDGKVDYVAVLKALPEAPKLMKRYGATASNAEAYVRANWNYVSKTLGLPASSPDAF